jgi:asparagine synthase (glutamine-hydrolysing)
MCGISGYFSVKKSFDEKDAHTMADALNHRGPDSKNFFFHNYLGFAHNRLKIIDLSERGKQPMHSANDRFVIIYNGEIYNYNEIASQLKSKESSAGFNFNSSTDTEVILETFALYGTPFIEQLNGMFAFAIYDKKLEELYIYRDRVGIKPLYYYWDGADFVFASELKAIKALTKLNLKLNYGAIPQYLNLGYIPSPHSIFQNVYKLEPGCFLKINKNGICKSKYWALNNALSDKVIEDEKKAMVLISELLTSSVQYQLKSDVPFGVFLSGGIDSSLIAANAAKLSGTRINTFSLGFENEKYNEAIYSRKIADYLNTNHNEFIVKVDDAIGILDTFSIAYDEPMGDSSGIPTLLLSKLVKQYATVTLSGEGGDELFHGYGAYKWAKRFDDGFVYYNRFLISKILNSFSDSRHKRAASLFQIPNKEYFYSHIYSQEQYYFSANEIPSLLAKDSFSKSLLNESIKYTDTVFNSNFNFSEKRRKFSPQEKQALYDVSFSLPDNLLSKVDGGSMTYSVETRTPYLDHRLIEKAVNVSSALKNKKATKYILKEILFQQIPASYFNRPKKGFSIPLHLWMKNEMYFLISDFLSQDMVDKVGLVNAEQVKELVFRFNKGEDYLYQRLWLLINLHRWAIKNMF